MAKAREHGPKRARRTAALAIGAMALSGCVALTPPPGGGGTDGRLRAVEGTWTDASGVATASLVNGRFVNVANDTGNRVAEGTYTYAGRDPVTGQPSITLSFFSLLRETRIRANCVLQNPNTLNCTNDSGQQFQLLRRSRIG
ncbi:MULTISPECIES: hypothetical protein [unclassified Roseitalea]|uniref:hypothetical protein n=1 Tax=unclassified Roseitalea TaxID=2639107 RepID=UPI00273E219F|nr:MULTISPECIES: hypothetical protein [unclassified Roseitalea]